LFLSFFVAQGLDPGIYLMHPGKGGQRTHIFCEWIFRWARWADGCSVILNDKFHAISLFQPEAIADLRISRGTVICPLLLIVLERVILTSPLYSKDIVICIPIELGVWKRGAPCTGNELQIGLKGEGSHRTA
jgi:hypothetical protein